MKKFKILIADDEVDVLDIMAKKIAAEGYEVIKASDGEQAWNSIVSELPDIIILDLNMPKMHGWTILQNLRKNPPSKKWQSVIIVSAQDELKDVQKGLALEADHYLTKPCSIQDILKAIHLMISLAPQRRPDEKADGEQSTENPPPGE